MTTPASFGQIEVNLTAGGSAAGGPARPDAPFRILVLGDLSGRAGRIPPGSNADLASRRPVRVDRDTLDEVIAKLAPELQLSLAGAGSAPVAIRFTGLDDFHADSLYQRLGPFEHVRSLRRRLQNPATFDAAAAEVRGWSAAPPAAEAKSAPAPAGAAPPPGGSGVTLDDLLAATPAQPRRPAGDAADWNALIQQIVAPHIRAVPAADPKQAELVARVDAAAGDLLRAVLHAPAFQALEALWRGVDFLTRRLETDRTLSVHLLDVTRADLTADLTAADDLGRTGLYKQLVERTVGTPGGEPWAVVLVCETFGPTQDDAELLGRLARIARAGDCAVVAAASPRLVGCDSFAAHPDPDDWRPPADPDAAAAWAALHQLPEAAHVGLALPRVLLRLPYGARSSPAEQVPFEELAASPDHESYLWANPAFAVGLLLGEAFTRSGWKLRPGEVSEIDGLPLATYREDGETQVKPCAEAVLTERAARILIDAGLMTLLSVRDRDVVRLASVRPLARTAAALAGRWS